MILLWKIAKAIPEGMAFSLAEALQEEGNGKVVFMPRSRVSPDRL